MKQFIVLATILIPLFAQSESRTRIDAIRPWYAVNVQDHFATGKDGCMAFTIADRRKARLEVYMEKMASGGHTLPMVIVVGDGYDEFTSADMYFSRKRFKMTKATFRKNQGSIQAAIIRFDQRDSALALLRSSNDVEVRLRDKSGDVFRRITFSLKNSSDVMSKAIETCRQ